METCVEILGCFEKQMRLKGLAKRTIMSYVQAVRDYCLYSQDFIISDVAEYLNALKIKVDNRILSRSHYNQVQYAFDKFWQVFYERRFPLLHRIEVPVIPPQIISPEDIIRAFESIENRQEKIIFGLGYFSMLRRAEIWHLDLYKDIDADNFRVYVRAGKGWKPRVTILSEYIAALVIEERKERQESRNSNPWVCAKPGSRDRYLCYSEIGRIICDAGKAIGCNNWHSHLLRHTGATHLDLQGISTRKIQRLEGHNQLGTTQRYITHTQDQVLEVRNRLDSLLCNTKKSNN